MTHLKFIFIPETYLHVPFQFGLTLGSAKGWVCRQTQPFAQFLYCTTLPCLRHLDPATRIDEGQGATAGEENNMPGVCSAEGRWRWRLGVKRRLGCSVFGILDGPDGRKVTGFG